MFIKEEPMLEKVQNESGFTVIELLMVMLILGLLAQMSMTFWIDLQSRSHDVAAISDGRNLVTVVRNNFVNLDDVDYTHAPGGGSDIGTVDTGGAARPEGPVFTMSPGVEATITGDSDPSNPGSGLVVATIYHTSGTKEATASGRREYFFTIDELGADILATF